MLATFGLISPGKGIEVAIAAMPAIVARHPKALYVIAGQTHPEVAKLHGEEYRISLERLARDLDLAEHVVFDDRFLELDDLSSMLAATTIYLTPYRSREQIVSGALTFAIVAGCPTVSTPYYYAEDLLASGAGVLVPFDDPAALADAVTGLLDDPERLERTRAEARPSAASWRGRRWAARPPACCARPSRSGRPRRCARPPPATLPRARASHLLTMVDDVGIVQHADGVVPTRSSGYCTDDVARLAIVALGLAPDHRRRDLPPHAGAQPGFLRHAWSPSARHAQLHVLRPPLAGRAARRRSPRTGRLGARRGRRGRAGPGAAASRASILLREMLPALAEQRWPRTMAFAALGLARAGPELLGARRAGRAARARRSGWPSCSARTRRPTGTGPRTC